MSSGHEMDCFGEETVSVSFWCSELCSINQTVAVQRGSVLDVRSPGGFCQLLLTLDKYSSWRVLYQ